jgi:hypothetical protein
MKPCDGFNNFLMFLEVEALKDFGDVMEIFLKLKLLVVPHELNHGK